MRKGNPEELVIRLLNRSVCAVQVAAVLEDNHGIYAWGHNHAGPDGFGMHAEAHCLSRANRDRLRQSTIYVAARRRRNGKPVIARPCTDCLHILTLINRIVYRDASGVWWNLSMGV